VEEEHERVGGKRARVERIGRGRGPAEERDRLGHVAAELGAVEETRGRTDLFEGGLAGVGHVARQPAGVARKFPGATERGLVAADPRDPQHALEVRDIHVQARVTHEPAGRVEQGHQRRRGGQCGRRVDPPLREVGGEVPHDLGVEMLDEHPRGRRLPCCRQP